MAVLFRRTSGQAAQGDDSAPTIEEVVGARLVGVEFVPIVHLATRGIAGYRAVPHGPIGSPFERPEAMISAATAIGLGAELDLVVHAAAFDAATRARLHRDLALVIAAGQPFGGVPVPDDLAPALALAHARLRVVQELTGRGLSADPWAAVQAIERARSAGWGVALRDADAGGAALGLLPFADPDVATLDLAVVPERPQPSAMRTLDTLMAHAGRTGAAIMATGVRDEGQARTAVGLGATFGEGAAFGRPGALPVPTREPAHRIPTITPLAPLAAADTPFGVATSDSAALPIGAPQLEALAAHIEQRASLDPDPTVMIACLPNNQMISGAPLTQLHMLSRGASLVVGLVGQLPRHGVEGVRLVELGRDDALRYERSLVLVGPHHAAMLTARARGDGYLYRVVYDRPTVLRAARAMLRRISPA